MPISLLKDSNAKQCALICISILGRISMLQGLLYCVTKRQFSINDALLNNFIVEWAIYIWTFIVGEPPVSVGLSKKLFTLEKKHIS